MFEDLFDFSDNEITESSSGLITFEEYLINKKNDTQPLEVSFNNYSSIDESESSGMITFLEYLESKNIIISDSKDSKDSLADTELSNELHESPKALWDGYIQMVTTSLRNRNIVSVPNIQDPQYLAESRAAYAESLVKEQRKIRDQIYFFTPGGRTVTVEDSDIEDVIGKAIIGKSKIG